MVREECSAPGKSRDHDSFQSRIRGRLHPPHPGGREAVVPRADPPLERAIYFLLFSLLRNEAEAEDAAQETAIKVYLNLKNFRGDSQFRTWVLSIARNEGLGRLRKAGNPARRLAGCGDG